MDGRTEGIEGTNLSLEGKPAKEEDGRESKQAKSFLFYMKRRRCKASMGWVGSCKRGKGEERKRKGSPTLFSGLDIQPDARMDGWMGG